MAKGFTLLELLVVLILIAVITAVVAPRITGGLAGANAKKQVRDMVSLLRKARQSAVMEGRVISFAVTEDKRQFRIGEQPANPLAGPATLALLSSEMSLGGAVETDETPVVLYFYPDGTSSGGVLHLNFPRGQHSINIGWLTGEVFVAY